MLTELDNCILGIIWRDGPMSAYGVRNHFERSTTVAWSSSTGTVYPAIRRLKDRDLLSAGKRSGPRKSQLLQLTRAGMDALRSWLAAAEPELGSSTADPIRTRVQFLAALDAEARARAIARYRTVTQEAIDTFELKAAAQGEGVAERLDHLGALGALAELRARLTWLETIEPLLMNLRADSAQ